jgi:uncharacterized protein (TIGR04222 family)
MPLNPLDWTAGPFLTLYISLAVAVFIICLYLRTTFGPKVPVPHGLTPIQLAYLAAGDLRLGHTLVVRMISSGVAALSDDGRKIEIKEGAAFPPDLEPFGTILPPGEITRRELQKKIKPGTEYIRAGLERLRLVPDSSAKSEYMFKMLFLLAVPMTLGILKVQVGMARHKPVGILVFLLFVTGFIGIFMLMAPRLTRAGRAALEAYRASNTRAARAPLETELPLAVALTGLAVLSLTPYENIYAASKTYNWDGGGGGDGGGGCGGGGCGGCGG